MHFCCLNLVFLLHVSFVHRLWSTRGLDNSCTGQVADWTTRGCHHQLCVLSFRSFGSMRDRELSSPRVDQSARCPVRESSSPRVSNPRVGVSASCPVTLASTCLSSFYAWLKLVPINLLCFALICFTLCLWHFVLCDLLMW